MTESTAYRTRTWQPHPRPEWVKRINEEGSCMDIQAIVPLDEESLLNTARQRTGLDDFGEPGWYELFKVLIRSLDTEADLNLMGRLMTRSDLLVLLEARLQIEDTYKRHPEIDDQELAHPLLIIGSPRTGSSFMQNLLSVDLDNGSLLHWESMFPCPPPEKATYFTDPRIEKADHLIKQWNRVTPEIQSMHEFGALLPVESPHLDCLSFNSPGWFNLWGNLPSYNAYASKLSMVSVYEYQKRVLKLLQWKNPRKRWILKTPYYLPFMPEVLKVFTNAHFIWTHRDPINIVSSLANVLSTSTWIRSDHLLNASDFMGQRFRADTRAAILNQAIDWLEDGTIPKDRVCHIHYKDLVTKPVEVVNKIYRLSGIEFTNELQGMYQKYMAENPRSLRPAHKYDAGSSEQVSQDRLFFKRYQDYFGIENEFGNEG